MSDAQQGSRDPQRGPAAERMARTRQRRRQGLRCVTLAVRRAEIDDLVARKLLDPEARNDPRKVAWALGLLLDQVLGRS